jgi:hypothetical protein
MRINIESVFDRFDDQLSAAMARAALDNVPGMTPKMALRVYRAFRRNAIASLSPWESVPRELAADTITGITPGPDQGISLGGGTKREPD